MMKLPKQIRVRIAPSPTGPLHIGTARTALFNWLFAKKYGGRFILRIEDTDLERSSPEFEQDILESLQWLGLQWDEGPKIPNSKFQITNKSQIPNNKFQKNTKYIGEYGPYRQSERLNSYEKYLKQLLDRGLAYWCFCSEEQLETERQAMLALGQPPKYSGRCRNLSKKEVEEKLKKGDRGVIRLKMPSKRLKFNDLIRGKLEFDTELIGDISLAKDLRTPLYNFAVVIDDYEMKISHIIRGEDHISNTPKQIIIQEALDFPRPEYAHHSLILAPDRSKLSKRYGKVSIREYRQDGYLPEALINFIGLLGWHPADDREIFGIDDLIEEFSLERIQKSGAIFNIQKLDWINGKYIRRLNIDDLAKRCLPFLEKAGLIQKISGPKFRIKDSERVVDFGYIKKAVAIEQSRLKKLGEIGELAEFFFKMPDYEPELLRWKNMSFDKIKESLEISKKELSLVESADFERKTLESILLPLAQRYGPGELLWPLRASLSGRKASPGPFEIMEVLGKEESLRRIDIALKRLR